MNTYSVNLKFTPDKMRENNNEIGNLLSTNEKLFTFNETPQEFLIAIVRDVRAATNKGPLSEAIHEGFWSTARTKHQTYGDIVANKPFLHMLVDLLPHRYYFVYTQVLKPYFLHQRLGVFGGVSAAPARID